MTPADIKQALEDDEIHGAKAELGRLLDHTTALALIAQLKAQADRIEALEGALRAILGLTLAEPPEDDEYGFETCAADGYNDGLDRCKTLASLVIQKGGGDGC